MVFLMLLNPAGRSDALMRAEPTLQPDRSSQLGHAEIDSVKLLAYGCNSNRLLALCVFASNVYE